MAAKYKDQEALEKAAFEAGKANPDKNLMTAFGDTGFYSLRDVEIAGFDPRKVSDAVKKGQEAAAKNSDKPNAEQRTETQTTEGVDKPLTPPSKMSIARIGEIATANDRLGRIKQLIEKGYSKEDAIKLNNKLEVQRKRELEHKRGQDAIKRKPEPTLEPLAEQDKSPALDDVIIQLSGKSSPAYLAARKLAHNIKNMMVEGVSFNDAYNHYRKLNSSGISTFDRTYKALTGRTPTQALLDPRKEKNLDQIKTVGDAIFNIKSGRDMAHWLSKHATSPVNRRIAERIAPLISADLKIKSIGYRKGNKPPAGMGNKQGWYIYERFESGKVDERILLWNEGEKRASTEEVVTHELIHAATSLAIANAKKADPKSEIAKVVKELDAIRKEAFEHYVSRKAKRQLTATEKSKEGKFAISKGLNNENSESAIDEFVAWGLTNPELQDILKGIKLKPKKSAWSEFVNAIGKLLGLKPTDNTALGRLLETTDKLLTLSEAEQVAESRSLGADARNANGDFTQERVNELRTKIDPKSDRVPMHKDIVNKAKDLQQQGVGNVTSNVLSMLRKGIADKYEPLKKLDEQLFGDNVLHDITSRAWVLAKTANSAQGALQAMLSFGRIRYNANQKLIETVHDKNDGGLMTVLEQLNEKHELADFFTWIAANRANDINERSKAAKAEIRSIKAEKKLLKQMRHEADSKRTRNQIEKAITDADSKIKALKKVADIQERFLTEEDIEVGLTLNQLERSDGTSREALFDKVFKEFNQYRGDILKIAEQSGIITSENREMWTDQFYVPFYRVLGDSDQVGMYPSAGLSRQDVIKKLKGSEKDLGDLMENALLNFHYLLNASLKNRAAMQALENGELAGIARQVQEHKIKDKDKATYVMIDGKKQWYEVDDPVFLSALMSMGNTKLPKGLQEIANVGGGAKVLLTKATTSTPIFITANFVRDMFLSPAMAKVGWKKGGTFHGARLWGLGEMNKVQADMLAAGGAFEFGFNRDEVKSDLEKSLRAKITQPHDAMRILGKPLYYGKKAIRGYGQVQGIAENANRAAIYDANLDKGKLYAAFEAMDLMDFGAGGSWAAIRLLNSLVPFLNAKIQGVDKAARQMGTVYRAARGKASPETAAQAKRFALYAGSLATASVALALQNADDEEYQELPEYAKNTNWFVRIGGETGEYILIPKPYSIGFMINTAERVTDSFTGAIKATDTLDYVKQTLFDTFMFNPTPQIAKPIMELYMNKNMFTGRAIETSSDMRYSKAERADYRTSEVAKMLGNDYVSPKQIDHLVKGYFSTVGDIVLNGTNMAIDAVTDNERPTKHWYEGNVIPARVFYKDLSSPSFTKSQQRFYDVYTEYSQAKADYKRAVEMGDKVKAKEILTEGRVKIALLPMMDKYKRKLTEVNNRIDAVRNNKTLSADEKRSYIDAYNRLKAETYSAVIDKVDSVLEQAKNIKY
ncbi:LPD38 domain-containing protein [Vibrio owensii]|uniref:LPD38 domain-containing protein n=1 Tax=Vibrio owensii TaxID=696485 RepID=UPI0038CE4808